MGVAMVYILIRGKVRASMVVLVRLVITERRVVTM